MNLEVRYNRKMNAKPVTSPHRRQTASRPARHPIPIMAGSLAETLLVASDALAAVLKGFALNDGLQGLWQAWPDLSPATRGAVQDLLYSTLRAFGRGTTVLARLLTHPLDEPRVTALLLIALQRLETRPETAHTLVDQAVDAAARISRGKFKNLVNAVLRNALRQQASLLELQAATPVAAWQHPEWWLEKVRRQHPADWQAILSANNNHPPMSLRLNPARTSFDAYTALLDGQKLAWIRLGDLSVQLETPCPVGRLPGFAEGLVSVQDWGAQQAARMLDLQDGHRVLDACAAPGGKTAHLLETARIELLALELEASRSQRVRDNLTRLGLDARILTCDCRQISRWWDNRPFDRILADVPCSASGVARRHPDIKWLRRAEDVAGFATVQAEILDALWQVLAPGGKMLYLTCSVFTEEGSEQVSRFADRHPDCQRMAFSDGKLDQYWLPGPQHDGFYFALLEKHV